MDPELQKYYDERNLDEDVQELIAYTNKKGEEAKNKDEDLMLFWKSLDQIASDDENTDQSNDEGGNQE